MYEDFSKYMNKPEEWDGRALLVTLADGSKWICCPFCQKKAIKITNDTKISKLPYKCTGSNCKKEFEINI